MADNSPRYVLSQRAADALKPILQAGAAFGSRPRPAHDVASGDAPELFSVRAVGTDVQVYIPSGTWETRGNVVWGANGQSNMTGVPGRGPWHVVGTLPATGPCRVWVQCTPPKYPFNGTSSSLMPTHTVVVTTDNNVPWINADGGRCVPVLLAAWLPKNSSATATERTFVAGHRGPIVLPSPLVIQAVTSVSLTGRTLTVVTTTFAADGARDFEAVDTLTNQYTIPE